MDTGQGSIEFSLFGSVLNWVRFYIGFRSGYVLNWVMFYIGFRSGYVLDWVGLCIVFGSGYVLIDKVRSLYTWLGQALASFQNSTHLSGF